MMKIIQICLTCVSFFLLPTFGTTNYTCPRKTRRGKTYSCSDTDGRKVTLQFPQYGELEIVCLNFQKLGAEFYDIIGRLEDSLYTFTFKQCRIPDVPFVNIIQIRHYDFGIVIVYHLDQSDNADYFRSYHFENLTFVTELSIYDARIESSKNLFDGILGIERLILQNNSLQDLPSGIFHNLTHLNHLVITYNKLTTLPADSFSDLTSLRYLTIDDNNLTTFPNDLLKNCLNLTGFSCKGNRLTTIPENMFENNEELIYLEFSFNRIDHLDGTLFYSLTTLNVLGLSGNHLTFIDSKVFANLRSLTKLDLSNNSLNDFEPDTEIQGHSEATAENSNRNYPRLDKNLFANLTSVEILLIDYNNLTFLPKDIFKNCKNLGKFSCKGNRLKTLPAEIFRSTQALQELELSCNMIESLSDTLFYSLVYLRSLNLAGNRLKSINSKLFANLHWLEKLDLTSNNLNNVEEDFHSSQNDTESKSNAYLEYDEDFRSLRNATEINSNENLDYEEDFQRSENATGYGINSKENLETEKDVLGGLHSLEYLFIDYNYFTTPPKDLLKNCKKVKTFSFEGNLLTDLPVNTFKRTSYLEELNLSYNKIESLNSSLSSLTALIKLNLSGNLLHELKWYDLRMMHDLRELDLSKNLLNEFYHEPFEGLENIIVLDLSSNQLASSTGRKFELPYLSDSLETLLLRNNSLTEVSFELRTNFNLRSLDLGQNNLTSVTLSELLNPTESINVHLEDNQITKIIIEGWATTDDYDTICKTARIAINLRHNPIKCDCHIFQAVSLQRQKYKENLYHPVAIEFHEAHCNEPNSLRNESLHDVDPYALLCSINDTEFTKNVICPSKCRCHYRPADGAIIVDCSGLGLVELPDELPKLEHFKTELRFGNNKLASLDKLLKFTSTGDIISLSLSNNHLTEVHQLEVFNNLKVLELDNNRITRMNSTLIHQLKNSTTLTSVTLHNNPWECDCSTKDFIEFVKFEIDTNKINHSIVNITCKNTQQSIKSMTDDLLCYESDQESVILIILYVSLALLGILCIVIVTLYFKFQYEIKVWMFTRKIFLRLVTRPENNEDKTYDAFITISNRDEAFVFDYLTPQLENDVNHAYKLFIESRDYVIGGWIPNQISETVRNSSRTIIVLSNNYLNNEWRRADFRASRLNAFREHDPRVIVILLDEINTENLDTELKDLLQNTTMKWGDTLFWEKLKYELPHPQINSERHRATDTSMPLKRRGYRE